MPRTSRSKRKSPARKKKFSLKAMLLRMAHWGLALGIWAAIALALLVGWYAMELPSLIEKPGFERKPAITLNDENGNAVARYGELKGINVGVEELPKHMVYAVLAIEDRRFYSHFGLDPIGLVRAIARNTIEGKVVQGGSTITQQLAKNLFLSRERTLKRKVQEALLALWLEHKLTKDEILTAYLNRVYLGSGTYGVEAAAQTYFNKSARDVNLREAAILAGLLKAPSRYSPMSNPRLSQQRADTVLSAMRDAGYITDKEAETELKQAVIPAEKPTGADGDSVRYFTDWVTGDLDKLIGTPNEDIVIDTTLVPEIQKVAEEALNRALEEEGAEKNVTQGAIIVMARDGAVLAMVGGRDYAASQFNRAVQAYRQPGSSFKPVVYLTALEHGYTPNTIVVDEPITTGRYRPTNFKSEYYGEVPLYAALAYSLNTISYKLAKEIGIGYVIGTARRLGIEADLQRDLSLALGSSGVPMIQMVTAYGTIANDGYAVKPYAIRRITDKDGKLIYQRPPRDPQSGRAMFDPQAIAQLQGMMRGVVDFGTGQGAKLGRPAMGKTGTSQDFRDAWFSGFTDQFVASVWVGNDDNTSMKRVTGGSIPARIWREVMTTAHNVKGRGWLASSLPSADSSLGGEISDLSGDFGGLLRRLLDTPATTAENSAYLPAPEPTRIPVSQQTRDRSKSWKLND